MEIDLVKTKQNLGEALNAAYEYEQVLSHMSEKIKKKHPNFDLQKYKKKCFDKNNS